MAYFLTAAAVLLHTCWWGAGLALAATPRRWQAYWPIFMPVCGFALQSAVVWVGAWADLAGVSSYAGWSQVVPAGLLLWQWRARGTGRWAAFRRFGALAGLMVITLVLLLRPLARATPDVTTVSLGSCDAADYAGGARALLEFARSDRDGFLGLTEVVQLHSVDTFYDYFLYLNHFTPSAILAHHAAVGGWALHELVSVTTAVFLVLSLPLVFWVTRTVFGFSAAGACFVSVLYGLSPVTWYAVYHVAMSQLLAAQAIALLGIVGVALWREGPAGRARWHWGALLMVAYGLIFGAYNFIILIALAPVGLWVLGRAGVERRWGDLLRWILAMGWPMVAAGAFYAARISGLIERLLLLQEYNFGWPIRGLTPEGWLGLVHAPEFAPWSAGWRWPVLALLIAGLLWTWRRARPDWRWRAVAFTVPVVVPYAYLLARGAVLGTYASYDAYKVLSVFYPTLLAVIGSWWCLARGSGAARLVVAALALLVLAGNVAATRGFDRALRGTALVVTPPLVALQTIERDPAITSLNLRIPDMWSRLWANAFLLRRPHYFPEYTYEARRNTALKGEWDVTSGLVVVRPDRAAGASPEGLLPEPFSLRPTADAGLRVVRGGGWFEEERLPGTYERWRWASDAAELIIDNPAPHPVAARLVLRSRSLEPRVLHLTVNDRLAGAANVGQAETEQHFANLSLPPGRSVVRLQSPTPATTPGGGDQRRLLVCVYSLELYVQP